VKVEHNHASLITDPFDLKVTGGQAKEGRSSREVDNSVKMNREGYEAEKGKPVCQSRSGPAIKTAAGATYTQAKERTWSRNQELMGHGPRNFLQRGQGARALAELWSEIAPGAKTEKNSATSRKRVKRLALTLQKSEI